MELERAQMREQLVMLCRLVESWQGDEERPPATRTTSESEVKLSEQDDIESYLTTFERIMRAYEVKEERWVVKLAPQLTGKAQQAYAAMKVEDAGTYRLLKEAILRRYDISEETHRQRFRDAERKDSESVSELAVRITDLFLKWTKSCKSIDEIRDLMVMEQLLHTLPSEIKVWVTERKPKTSTEAAEMSDNYLRARKQQKDGRRQQEGKPWAIAKGPKEGGKRVDSSPKPAVSDGGTHRSTNDQRGNPRGDPLLQLWKEGSHFPELSQQCAVLHGIGGSGT